MKRIAPGPWDRGCGFYGGLSHPLRDDGGQGELQEVRQEVGDHAQKEGAEDADGLAALKVDGHKPGGAEGLAPPWPRAVRAQ